MRVKMRSISRVLHIAQRCFIENVRTFVAYRSGSMPKNARGAFEGARKKTVTFVTVFFQRCVPQAECDVSYGSDVRFAREVCLRHVNGTFHIAATEESNITMQGITSLWRSQNLTKILKPLISGTFRAFRGKNTSFVFCVLLRNLSSPIDKPFRM